MLGLGIVKNVWTLKLETLWDPGTWTLKGRGDFGPVHPLLVTGWQVSPCQTLTCAPCLAWPCSPYLIFTLYNKHWQTGSGAHEGHTQLCHPSSPLITPLAVICGTHYSWLEFAQNFLIKFKWASDLRVMDNFYPPLPLSQPWPSPNLLSN